MKDGIMPQPAPLDGDRALRSILEGTATETGDRFFRALVQSLANALGVHCALVTEYIEETRELRALAFLAGDEWRDGYVYKIAHTPCEKLVDECKIIHYPEGVRELFPNDKDLHGLESYLAIPLIDLDERVLGTLAVMDQRSMPEEPREMALFRIFGARAAAELQRVRAEKEKEAREQEVASLSEETALLREALQEASHFEEIIGESPALIATLQEIEQVSPTDATVLILGESGTGKELIANAIHRGSTRAAKRLVKVNCAAIPSTLMESEFFGHEKGAFTGATDKRDGRFALADGGTIFLDEVGELPLDLQAKLLRVLQDGEFEPVGSSSTKSVDVRVVAATNRDLKEAVDEGCFRQDLYYRLNVFPVELPPLRDRGKDILLLAEAFAARYAQRMGRKLKAFDADARRRLCAYGWPGNVRELQNIIERAVITARGGVLDFARVLPDSELTPPEASDVPGDRVRTMDELLEFERQNIVLALQACGGKVSGEQGAAKLLGIKASTLNSRIKALGIERRANF